MPASIQHIVPVPIAADRPDALHAQRRGGAREAGAIQEGALLQQGGLERGGEGVAGSGGIRGDDSGHGRDEAALCAPVRRGVRFSRAESAAFRAEVRALREAGVDVRRSLGTRKRLLWNLFMATGIEGFTRI